MYWSFLLVAPEFLNLNTGQNDIESLESSLNLLKSEIPKNKDAVIHRFECLTISYLYVPYTPPYHPISSLERSAQRLQASERSSLRQTLPRPVSQFLASGL